MLKKINGLLEEGSPVQTNFSKTSNTKFKIIENIEKNLFNSSIKNPYQFNINQETASNLLDTYLNQYNRTNQNNNNYAQNTQHNHYQQHNHHNYHSQQHHQPNKNQNKYYMGNKSINEEHTYSSNLKLEEMITLEVLKSSKLTGLSKKMLHVPSMRTYIVKVRRST